MLLLSKPPLILHDFFNFDTYMQSFSERALILSERERHSKVQGWAWARAHPKSTERERKLALIFALKI